MVDSSSRYVEANGLMLHITEQGHGPLVILCHGFPETSHVWRHQLVALSNAGFRAVAPDLRGFGKSEIPAEQSAYTPLHVVGDMVDIVKQLGEKEAVIVGGDWGATIAWQAAQLRPDVFRAVVALGVPMMGRAPMLPSKLFPKTDAAQFYIHYFCEHGRAELEFGRDVPQTLRKIYFAASGSAGDRGDPATPNPFGMVPSEGELLSHLPEPAELPSWLHKSDFQAFVDAFESSGFLGGLSYYRNLDQNWLMESALVGKKIEVPAAFLIGERDTGLSMPGMDQIIAAMPALVPNLKLSKVVPKAGHWLQQEAPDEVNQAIIGFLRGM